MDYFLSLFADYGQHQPLAHAAAALLALVVVAAIIFVVVSRRQAALSRRIDRQQEEVRADIGKLRTVIAEAISGRWTAMEEKLGGAIGAAAVKLEEQQRQQAAAAADILQKQNTLLESLAATMNERLREMDERQKQSADALDKYKDVLRAWMDGQQKQNAEALAQMARRQEQQTAENKKTADDYGVYLHDQSAALAAAQERTLSAAAEQLRQSADALLRVEQSAAGFAERAFADIDRRFDGIDRRVHLALSAFENLDGKLALLREVQDEVNRAGKDIGALSQMLTLAAAAVSAKERMANG